ncbi:XRE family transcriptional regulator [Streptomyces sp. VRA16 Mangrove soil]|uniref:helix-turn-helix domain-containing protein n=1 Tax=Streptomyces sp. VRA16 Mangrove soil TaxID=2817434 RepID=UPI001A9E96BB|nr:XRE family transcriptional regulator [Streptomyces sp. VRA16 Mangrove soil]MBO1335148.1 XRE family transcriptional regulator [Streptomyces sp. VRA16 Mangrove soil]
MPRWRALPDELDPQVKEFASQLRRLVDRSGLGIAALADRTGYSKTSWERYLNGRLLAPKGAIVALAEVTGTNPVHLTTMWELAERAWSRSEMRHDMTMEAIRISQARAALGEFGSSGTQTKNGAGKNGSATASRPPTGVAGPAGVSPTVPPQAQAPSLDQFGPPPETPAPVNSGGSGGRRRLTMFLAGVVGAALVVLIAYVLTSGGDGKGDKAEPSKSPTTSAPQLPAGVQCVGASCTGKDPEAMGCGGDLADSPLKAALGTANVEVRYSKTCKAAWARIQFAAPGDSVTLSVGSKTSKKGLVGDADTDAYTPMIAVDSAAEAKACGTLASGRKGCTK